MALNINDLFSQYNNIVNNETDITAKRMLEELKKADPQLFSNDILSAIKTLSKAEEITFAMWNNLANLSKSTFLRDYAKNGRTSQGLSKQLVIYINSVSKYLALDSTKIYNKLEKLMNLVIKIPNTSSFNLYTSVSVEFKKNPETPPAGNFSQFDLSNLTRIQQNSILNSSPIAININQLQNIKNIQFGGTVTDKIINSMTNLQMVTLESGKDKNISTKPYLNIVPCFKISENNEKNLMRYPLLRPQV